MKATHFSISIPEPCTEGWEHMTPCEKGRFCGSCQKTVIDFTGYSDAELAAFFSRKENENTCGRFYAHQIENKIFSYTAPVKRTHRTLAMAASVAALTVMSFAAEAQDVKKDLSFTPTITSVTDTPSMKGLSADTLIIEGVVNDEKGEPIMTASIQVKGSEGIIAGSSTDLDGRYIITLPLKAIRADTLHIKCSFFTEEEVSVPIQADQATYKVDFVLKKAAMDNTRLMTVGLIRYRPNPPLIDKDNPGSSTTIPAKSLDKMPR